MIPTIPTQEQLIEILALEGDLVEHHGDQTVLTDLETEEEVWRSPHLLEEAA